MACGRCGDVDAAHRQPPPPARLTSRLLAGPRAGILVSVTSALLYEALAPLRSNPPGSAVLLDIDGTLSPIVENAADASVPEATRKLLIAVARRYGLVACVSGRRASEARAMVSIGSITYLGSHGAELLESGWTESVLDPALKAWVARVEEFRRQSDTSELRRRRVRIEDKGPIVAFHWRGAVDEPRRASRDRRTGGSGAGSRIRGALGPQGDGGAPTGTDRQGRRDRRSARAPQRRECSVWRR